MYGLQEPLLYHSLKPNVIKANIANKNLHQVSYQQYARSFGFDGTLGDKLALLQYHLKGKYIPMIIALSTVIGYDLIQGSFLLYALKDFLAQVELIDITKERLYYLKQYFFNNSKISNIIKSKNNIYLDTILNNDLIADEKNLNELFKYLAQSTFANQKDIFYRRGMVLWLHKKIFHYQKTINSVVDQVGIIDAYLAIVKFLKSLQKENFPLCFTEFSDLPGIFEINNGWITTTCNACITNSITLGNNNPKALILSGPHGSGKSTILILLGQTALLSHSIGINFASSVTTSLLKGVRSNFLSNAIPEKGISTFMAAQLAIDRIERFMTETSENQTSLILLSEPYKGTIEAEAAYRINGFCEQFIQHSNILMGLETHVKEPIIWTEKMPHIFCNKQMIIQPLNNGKFERTFQITDGAALWWFDDQKTRSRYIDWISTII